MQNPKFPKLLDSRLRTILGEEYEGVISAFSHERRGSFRINTLKSSEEEVQREFGEKWIVVEKFTGFLPSQEWRTHGIFTFSREHEYAIKGTRAFYDGKIYLQSLSSMLPVLALAPEKWETILDVCAAPGSKTTQIAMTMGNEGKIVALEQNQIRYDKLMYNAKLQWATIVEWQKLDARHYFDRTSDETFDRILLDAPCSAEGRISLTNEKTYGFWSLENIQKKAELQYELLTLAFAALKKWGTLVYSTCTLAPEENEWVISDFLEETPSASLEIIDIGLSDKPWWKSGIEKFGKTEYSEEMKKAVRILPSGETEGFFMVKIVKG